MMTERGAIDDSGVSRGVIRHTENNNSRNNRRMADMNYRQFNDDGSETGDPPHPDGDHTLHVDVEPAVEMGGHSTGGRSGGGGRRVHGGLVYKSVGCSKMMAICLLLFILASILMIALVASFARPGCVPTVNVTLPEPKPTQPLDTDGVLFPWKSIRLPNSIRPLNYTLFLNPDLATGKVIGHVEITVQATDATDFIVLHAADMNITKPRSLRTVKVDNSSPTTISVTKMQRYDKNEMVHLSLARSIEAGRSYLLALDFDYSLRDGLEGFYRSTYKVGTEER